MPVSVSIEPLTPSIDMYDSADTSSAYSLSGHIAITLTPSSSMLGLSRASPQNLLLTSLELTFEGHTELLLTDVGYSPLRLISITKELVSASQPVHISESPDEHQAEWRVVFDLAVPGWLPATAVFGDNDGDGAAGVSYALYARARFLSASPDLDDAASVAPSTSAPSVWNNLCSVVRLGAGRPRSVHAEKVPVRLTRFVSPPSHVYDADDEAPPAFLRSVYAIQAIPDAARGAAPLTNIPADVLRGVQLHAVVPSRTSADEDSVPLILRLRSRSEDADTRDRLRVLGFEADVVQVETFHTSPSARYAARYPVPPANEQPPVKRLRSPHSVGPLFELGIVSRPPAGRRVVRERSIVPAAASKVFKVRGSDACARGVRFEEGWLRMEVGVPVSAGLGDDGAQGKRVTAESPFLDVRHEMRVKLTVGFEQPGDAALLSDDMTFVVPLDFVLLGRAAAPPVAPNVLHAHSARSCPRPHPPMNAARAPSRTHSVSALRVPPPPPPPLPAYSQLFHENGDLKDEWHVALPLYREKDAASGAPASGMRSPCASSSGSDSPSSAGFEASSAGSASPTSEEMPLTPAGRGPPGAVRHDEKYGESFLRFEEDESEAAGEEVQYGIAF